MTRSDVWKKRPCVLRYRAFRDEISLKSVVVNNGDAIIFALPMPNSWSKKKRAKMDGQPHQQTPDLDNLTKAILDAIYSSDAHIYKLTVSKYWAYYGSITVISPK